METKEILKYVMILAALPLILPFIKLLVKDLLHAFEEDGGLLGSPPSPTKLEEIRREKEGRTDPLVSEPLAHVRKTAQASSSKSDGSGVVR